MMRMIGVVVVAVAVLFLMFGGRDIRLVDDPVISVPGDDQTMNTAIARARETLPTFWSVKDNPTAGQNGLALKVRITDGPETEHFWLVNISRAGGAHSGVINNEPRSVKTVKFGQDYAFDERDITDWMYRENGKIYGGFTIRVLLDKIPKDEADKLRAVLAFEPR